MISDVPADNHENGRGGTIRYEVLVTQGQITHTGRTFDCDPAPEELLPGAWIMYKSPRGNWVTTTPSREEHWLRP